MTAIRSPAVAGSFYPADPGTLRSLVERLLAEAPPPAAPRAPKALIVPHAGYVYSGPVAASAFRQLEGATAAIRRIVLLGPSHRVPLRGLGLPAADFFETPLGRVAVDETLASEVAALPHVAETAAAHAWEHSLEVELPFLQVLLGEFTLLPLVVGDASPEEVAAALERAWGGEETRVVISSDLSHYLPYEAASRVDRETARAILDLAGPIPYDHACGAEPINGLLVVARRRRMRPTLLDLRNSGDTAGDRASVVGYAAFRFEEAA